MRFYFLYVKVQNYSLLKVLMLNILQAKPYIVLLPILLLLLIMVRLLYVDFNIFLLTRN